MAETLRTHTPINMCKEDLEAPQRLETIFSRAARTNTNVQIKATPIRTPPRVLTKTPNQDTNKTRMASLQELSTQPSVHQTIFTDIPKQSSNQANETVEEHRSLGGTIISRLDNGAFVGLIHELLVFSYFHVEVVPPVTTHPCRNA